MPKGGQNEVVWIIGEASMYPCGKLGGSGGHVPLGNFDFRTFIRCSLVESGIVFAQTSFTIYCVIKAFIIDLHVK